MPCLLPPRKLFILAALVINMQTVLAQLTVTLTPTNYSGYNISCFGKRDGSITATAGGTGAYIYEWRVDQTTPTVTGLAAGYYRVKVIDANGESAETEITLTEPEVLSLNNVVHTYSNSYNVTCHFCADGIVNTQPVNGIAPYAYIWSDGGATQNRTGIDAGSYLVMVTDANGCTAAQDVAVTAPDRNDWTMTGNAGTNPSNQFIGTTDYKDLVFKTNNSERLKITGGGAVKINSLSGNGFQMVFADSNGVLKLGGVSTVTLCTPLQPPAWFPNFTPGAVKNLWTCPDMKIRIGLANPITNLQVAGDAIFSQSSGTLTSAAYIRGLDSYSVATTPDFTWYGDLQTGVFHSEANAIAFTNGGTESMRIVKDANGNIIVGIGLDPLSQTYISGATPYKLMVAGKIGARDVVVRNASLDWPDYVFNIDYKLLPLNEIENYIKQYKHLPNVPNANEISDNGQAIGTLQILQQQKIEDIYLYLIALEKRVKELEKENMLLKK